MTVRHTCVMCWCVCVKGLKTNTTFGQKQVVSSLTAHSDSPAPPQARSPTWMPPRTPREEPVCMLDDGLDDPDNLQRNRGHHLCDVPVNTEQRGTEWG